MPMIIKNYTVHNGIRTSIRTGDDETPQRVVSRPGISAEIMLLEADGKLTTGTITQGTMTVHLEIDPVPAEAAADMDTWLREQLIGMMKDG